MATIVKQKPITIKCSNSSKDIEHITCIALESSTKQTPIRMIWIYSNTANTSKEDFMPAEHLQTTLSDTLNYFPILAGRATEDAKGNVTIHLTNEGILYTEAECMTHTLDYFVPRTLPDEEFEYEHINISDLSVRVKTDLTGACVSIQVTRLKCHSVILSISALHCLMDAQSTSDFINAWASGKPPKKMPVFDKTFVLYPTEEQRQQISTLSRPKDCVFNRTVALPSGSPFSQVPQQQRVISKVYFFSADELKMIKNEASKNLTESIDFISTYDALYAHMILVIAAATQTSLTDTVKILQAFNGRPSFVSCCSPTVLNYFGSLPFWLYALIPSDRQPTLSSLAQQIHEMHSKQSANSLRDYNAYLMSDDGSILTNRVDADFINRDFHCTSWRKMNMLDANFGNSGFPVYSGPADCLNPRYFPMMDACIRDSSVYILLGLREQDYERMMQQNMLHKFR
ncbi:unnamed protein product [Rotaria sp. Silwood2]|nr:unnamed protein product [Rotaria sp. Silwood2]CAF2779608.1 unnamed protein product [Rotaria sp. Silwood2]CAF3292448.1 unnamed protein product [Rotaria sp. Silwood2]CAF3374078.1 unnamed protein product [Rotaria sp. Silwood2]CAF4102471.1 unnamed protein product [Rotaria sp. Silwood2]